jgi:succinate dehydrogenase/fumarate reductase-like Fe-S protein
MKPLITNDENITNGRFCKEFIHEPKDYEECVYCGMQISHLHPIGTPLNKPVWPEPVRKLEEKEVEAFCAKLDYKRMLQEINDLLQSDFVFDMSCRLASEPPVFSPEEAEQMASLLGRLYSISHCISCTSCNGKYQIK